MSTFWGRETTFWGIRTTFWGRETTFWGRETTFWGMKLHFGEWSAYISPDNPRKMGVCFDFGR